MKARILHSICMLLCLLCLFASCAKKPQSIALSDTSIELEVGDYEYISATVTPTDAKYKLEWISSNTDIATIDNMKIRALSVGSTTITVKTNNGWTASCTVVVVPKVYTEEELCNIAKKYARENAPSIIERTLRNPSSLQIHQVVPYERELLNNFEKYEAIYYGYIKGDYSYYLMQIDYSAQNGFGGYERDVYHYYVKVDRNTGYACGSSEWEYNDAH